MMFDQARFLLAAQVILASWLGSPASAQSVLGVIQGDPQLTRFAAALTLSGLDSTLSDESTSFTVFAPLNRGVTADINFVTYAEGGWDGHLKSSVENHIVEGSVLTRPEIFDNVKTTLSSMAGTLDVSQVFQQVQGVPILENPTSPISGTNGIVHKVDGIMKNDWRGYQLRNVEVRSEVKDRLGFILNQTKFDSPLQQFNESGATFVAPRNRAFNSGNQVIVAELEDPEEINRTTGDLLYTIIDQNIYKEDLGVNFQLLVLPRNPVAHMWVTVEDFRAGILRFNDAAFIDQYLTENGIVQITDKVLVPPGIAELITYTADYTNIEVKDIEQFFDASEWNRRNLSKSIGTDQGSFTLLAPLDTGFAGFNRDDNIRLATPVWIRHMWNFLEHLLIEPALTVSELKQMTTDAGGLMSYKTLSGFNVTFSINSEDNLMVDEGEFMDPSNIRGVDGLIHLVSQVALPPSVLYSVYDQTAMNPEMSIVTNLIDTIFLNTFIDSLSPVTFFSPPNDAWFYFIPTLEIEDVIKNHIFEGLLFDDVLVGLDGQEITSSNGKNWPVTVLNGTVYIGDNAVGGPQFTNATFLTGPNSTNILARTGVIHHVDSVFLDFGYATLDGPMPTLPPFARQPAQPTAAGGGGGGGGGVTPTQPPSGGIRSMVGEKAAATLACLVALLI